jgi:hypothetical protein
MTGIGTSLLAIAVGAILRFAVYQDNAGGFNIGTVGVILLIVGVIGLIISISLLLVRRRTDIHHYEQGPYVEPPPRRGYHR